MNVYIKLFHSMSKSVDTDEFTYHNSKVEESDSLLGDAFVLTVRDLETNQLMFRCNLRDIEAYSVWK